MIEIPFEERQIITDLYDTIKNIVLSKKDNSTYTYHHKQHHLYEESDYPGISKNYYNESGEVTFINSNNQQVKLTFSRWHPHKHNGYSGLNGNPILEATITIDDEVYWNLDVKSGTLYYKALVSSTDIPIDLLKEIEIKEDTPKEEVECIEPVRQVKPNIDVNDIKDKYTNNKKAKEDLLIQIKQEIETATNEIINRHAKEVKDIEDDINNSKKELDNLDELINKYSTFDIDLIGSLLQKLISFMENSDYVYQESKYTFKRIVHGPIDSWDEEDSKKIFIIVLKSRQRSIYTEEELNNLIKNGECLVLVKQDIYSAKKDITFYTSKDGDITSNISFNNFDYIKEFIDTVIRHRYDNEEYSIDDLNNILKEFLMNNKSSVISKIDTKLDEKILKLTTGGLIC